VVAAAAAAAAAPAAGGKNLFLNLSLFVWKHLVD